MDADKYSAEKLKLLEEEFLLEHKKAMNESSDSLLPVAKLIGLISTLAVAHLKLLRELQRQAK